MQFWGRGAKYEEGSVIGLRPVTMTSRYIVALVLMPTLVLATALAAPTTILAACNYNGYIHSNGNCSNSWRNTQPFTYPLYSYNTYLIEQYITYLQELIDLLQTQVDNKDDFRSNVDVETRSAINIDEDSAELRGRIDLNYEDEASVYFEYGTSRSNLSKDTKKITIDEHDDDDFSIDVRSLHGDTLYFFRAVAIDEDNDKDYGAILSFRTNDNDERDEPSAETHSATYITDDSAYLRGSVDMSFYKNGRVFFVYGEDENQVGDIADDYDTYNDIDEDGEDLQKMLVDTDLDSSDWYSQKVSRLDPDTRIYYNICVEYEDTLTCGDTESFWTKK